MFSIRLCMDWKVGAAIAVAAIILVTAFFAGGFALPSWNGGGMTGFFTAFSGGAAKNVTVDAVLDIVDFGMATKADAIEVELLNPSSEITVGNSLVDLSSRQSVKMIVKGWDGKITVNGSLFLDGTAEEIEIDGIILTPTDKTSKLFLSGLAFADLDVKKVSLNGLRFPEADGYVYIDSGKTTIRLDAEPLEFQNFVGDVRIDTSLRLSGIAGKLTTSGQNTVDIR